MLQTMRIKVLFIFISLLVVCPTHGQDSYVSPKIEEYVDFINDCNTSPVDYVMGLFDRYDVVILGERDHRDTTQYDLIEQIMADPRFIDQVGLIMTEIGVYNMTGTVDCIVNASYASDREFETALWDAYQNLDYTPLWENTNFISTSVPFIGSTSVSRRKKSCISHVPTFRFHGIRRKG